MLAQSNGLPLGAYQVHIGYQATFDLLSSQERNATNCGLVFAESNQALSKSEELAVLIEHLPSNQSDRCLGNKALLLPR